MAILTVTHNSRLHTLLTAVRDFSNLRITGLKIDGLCSSVVESSLYKKH